MRKVLKGKGVSNGIGFGKVVLLKPEDLRVEKSKIDNVEEETEKFNEALNSVIKDTEEIIKKSSGTEKDIMQAYLMILKDETLTEQTLKIIKEEKYNSAYATEVGFNSITQIFENMDDTYLASRSSDILDMKKKIIAKLLNKEVIDFSHLPRNTIIVAKEMTTSDTAKLDLNNIAGIVTELGGTNSHVSIMARTHEIPAIVGIKHAIQVLREKDFIAINGTTGEIFVNPTEEECVELGELKEKLKQELQKFKGFWHSIMSHFHKRICYDKDNNYKIVSDDLYKNGIFDDNDNEIANNIYRKVTIPDENKQAKNKKKNNDTRF